MSFNESGNGYDSRGNPDTEWWMREIRKGVKFRKEQANQVRWQLWRKYYRGEWSSDTMPVNLFFKNLRTVVPRVYFRNPSIVLTPGAPGFDMLVFTQLLQRLDNKLIRTMRMKQTMKMIVQDAFLYGTGVGKLGFGAQFTPTPELGPVMSPISKKGERFEYHSYVNDNMPWFMRVHPGSFIVPYGQVSYDDCRWSAVWTRRPAWDVQNDPRLSNNKDLRGTTFDVELNPHEKLKQDPSLLDIIEVRDRKFQTVFLLAPYNTNRTLYKGVDELQPNGRMSNYPVIFNPDSEVFWGIADSQILEPQQLEANETRTAIMKHRRIALVKLLAKRKGISEDEAAKIVKEDVSPIVWTEDDPATVVMKLEGGGAPDDLFKTMMLVENEVKENIGFSRNQFGDYAQGSNDKTATESQIVNMASEIRVDERRDTVADAMVDMIEDLHSVVFNQWSGEVVIDMVGPNGLPLWVAFKPDMLRAAKSAVQIDPDSTAPVSARDREMRANIIYEKLKLNPFIDPLMLTKYYLQETDGSHLGFLIRQQAMMMGDGAPGSTPGTPLTAAQYATQLPGMIQQAERGRPNLQSVA